MIDMDNLSTNNYNPRAFWDHIKMIGHRKVNTAPMQVYQNNELVSDYETVLHTWKDNFSDLYNRPKDASTNYDNQFYTEAINHKNQLEEEMPYPSYDNKNC